MAGGDNNSDLILLFQRLLVRIQLARGVKLKRMLGQRGIIPGCGGHVLGSSYDFALLRARGSGHGVILDARELRKALVFLGRRHVACSRGAHAKQTSESSALRRNTPTRSGLRMRRNLDPQVGSLAMQKRVVYTLQHDTCLPLAWQFSYLQVPAIRPHR